jgi:dihydroflavonol-4-reductase
VIDASIACGVKKIIHISSTHAVQEEPLDRPMTEDRPYKTEKNYAYDYSKAKGEQIMLEAFRSQRISGVVIRPSSIIGPFDYKPSEMGKALLDIKSNKIPVLPPGGYDFIDVRDVAGAIVTAIEKGRSGEVYLVTGNYYSIKEFTKDVGKVLNSKVPTRTLPFWLMVLVLPFVILFSKLKRASPVFSLESILALKNGHANMDNSKAKDELNLKVRDLSETFTDFFDWNKRMMD